MIRIKNEIFKGSEGRESVMDISIPENFNQKLCFFVHGYKGYKDWGAWNLIEQQFVEKGYGFVKFNLTYNGGTVENPIDFPDLEAFSENTYSKEVIDVQQVLKYFKSKYTEIWKESQKILMGHSRGGGDVILVAADNPEIDVLVTWAAISSIWNRFPVGEELEAWRNEGVRYVANERTKQRMPHKFSFYEDFIQNKARLDIEKAAKNIHIPWLIVHGDQDEAVSISEGEQLKNWSKAEMKIIEKTGHTFDVSHPFTLKELPAKASELVRVTCAFLDCI